MIVFLIFYTVFVATYAKELIIAVPPVKPAAEDQYICHGINLKNDTFFITGFQPKGNVSHAHHMMLHSCVEPGSTESTWNCLEMADKNSKPVCKSGYKVIYAWAMNAAGFQLPEDVSIMIGKATGSPYLVLQNHYKNVDYFKTPDALPDQSGFILQVQNKPTKKLAGLYVLITDGYIPEHSRVFMEAACSYTGKIPLNPFAFRTHTHKLGKLVSGYVIHNNHWEEIGKKSPQTEQLFYPVTKNLTIQPGDTLASRCIMENKGDKLIKIGSTRKDEMCNFYIYYWVHRADRAQIDDKDNEICFTPGWPNFKWDRDMAFPKIPDMAAIMPGETEIIKEMISDFQDDEKDTEKLISEMLEEDPQYDLDDDMSIDNLSKNYKFDNFPNEN